MHQRTPDFKYKSHSILRYESDYFSSDQLRPFQQNKVRAHREGHPTTVRHLLGQALSQIHARDEVEIAVHDQSLRRRDSQCTSRDDRRLLRVQREDQIQKAAGVSAIAEDIPHVLMEEGWLLGGKSTEESEALQDYAEKRRVRDSLQRDPGIGGDQWKQQVNARLYRLADYITKKRWQRKARLQAIMQS